MMQEPSTNLQSGPAEVQELIAQRDTVQAWLARLDEQRGKVSERVLARVREDYQLRLRETLDALAGHRRSIQEEMERATSRLVAAEEEHQAAVDQLEEGRLRNMIGEIEQATWAKRETELNVAVEAASARESEIRAETRRLTQLLDQLDDREPRPAAPTPPGFYVEDGSQPFQSDQDDTWLDEPLLANDAQDQDNGADEPEAPLESDADPFLDEIDRSLRPPTAANDATQVSDPDGPTEDTAPKPGLKCSECGYTNDLSAWFCGVCGADIG